MQRFLLPRRQRLQMQQAAAAAPSSSSSSSSLAATLAQLVSATCGMNGTSSNNQNHSSQPHRQQQQPQQRTTTTTATPHHHQQQQQQAKRFGDLLRGASPSSASPTSSSSPASSSQQQQQRPPQSHQHQRSSQQQLQQQQQQQPPQTTKSFVRDVRSLRNRVKLEEFVQRRNDVITAVQQADRKIQKRASSASSPLAMMMMMSNKTATTTTPSSSQQQQQQPGKKDVGETSSISADQPPLLPLSLCPSFDSLSSAANERLQLFTDRIGFIATDEVMFETLRLNCDAGDLSTSAELLRRIVAENRGPLVECGEAGVAVLDGLARLLDMVCVETSFESGGAGAAATVTPFHIDMVRFAVWNSAKTAPNNNGATATTASDPPTMFELRAQIAATRLDPSRVRFPGDGGGGGVVERLASAAMYRGAHNNKNSNNSKRGSSMEEQHIGSGGGACGATANGASEGLYHVLRPHVASIVYDVLKFVFLKNNIGTDDAVGGANSTLSLQLLSVLSNLLSVAVRAAAQLDLIVPSSSSSSSSSLFTHDKILQICTSMINTLESASASRAAEAEEGSVAAAAAAALSECASYIDTALLACAHSAFVNGRLMNFVVTTGGGGASSSSGGDGLEADAMAALTSPHHLSLRYFRQTLDRCRSVSSSSSSSSALQFPLFEAASKLVIPAHAGGNSSSSSETDNAALLDPSVLCVQHEVEMINKLLAHLAADATAAGASGEAAAEETRIGFARIVEETQKQLLEQLSQQVVAHEQGDGCDGVPVEVTNDALQRVSTTAMFLAIVTDLHQYHSRSAGSSSSASSPSLIIVAPSSAPSILDEFDDGAVASDVSSDKFDDHDELFQPDQRFVPALDKNSFLSEVISVISSSFASHNNSNHHIIEHQPECSRLLSSYLSEVFVKASRDIEMHVASSLIFNDDELVKLLGDVEQQQLSEDERKMVDKRILAEEMCDVLFASVAHRCLNMLTGQDNSHNTEGATSSSEFILDEQSLSAMPVSALSSLVRFISLVEPLVSHYDKPTVDSKLQLLTKLQDEKKKQLLRAQEEQQQQQQQQEHQASGGDDGSGGQATSSGSGVADQHNQPAAAPQQQQQHDHHEDEFASLLDSAQSSPSTDTSSSSPNQEGSDDGSTATSSPGNNNDDSNNTVSTEIVVFGPLNEERSMARKNASRRQQQQTLGMLRKLLLLNSSSSSSSSSSVDQHQHHRGSNFSIRPTTTRIEPEVYSLAHRAARDCGDASLSVALSTHRDSLYDPVRFL